MKKILVFDANSLLNRAFYGIRPLTNSKGLPTNAIFGYINMLRKHLEAEKPDFAVAAFDLHAPTFRHKLDPAYKATRKPMPEELRAQMPYLKQATQALGIAVLSREGYEADDLLGTLSRLAEESGNEAVLVTGDRDSYQLVGEKVTLILAGTGKDEPITPQVIREKFGLAPRQMIDVKALAGDASDNIPGVRGIGEKSALKLIGLRGTLDGVYEDLDSLPLGPAAKEKLRAGKEDAYRSRRLAEICRTVPEVTSIEAYPYAGPDREKLLPLLTELEFEKLLSVYGLDRIEEAPLQGSLPALPEAEEEVGEADADRILEEVFCLHLCDSHFYTRLEGKAVRLVGDIPRLLKRSRPVVLDAKAYYHAAAALTGEIEPFSVSFDLSLAAYVINSQNSAASLSRLALLYLRENSPFSDPGAERTLSVMERVLPLLQQDLEESGARELYFQTELPLAKVLAKMERVGFAVLPEEMRRYGESLTRQADALKEEIFALAGEEFLISSPKQLGRVLFETLQLPAGKKTKTGYATDAETLSRLRHLTPIIDLVLAWRTVTKLNSTYVEGLLKVVGEDGRIHTVFHQTLTATGRLSSAEPNLQNIPVKTELGREMRRFFVAEGDKVLVDADYSQIELRLLAHLSGDETMLRFFREGVDIHTRTAAEIFRVPPENVTKEMRKSAKAVNFGIVYGIGEYSLGQDLGIPTWQAKEYIRSYFALFPGVREFLDRVKQQAHRDGFVTTLYGRRRYIPELKGPKKPLIAFGERVAMNAPIQGTAADLIKMAMVRVDRRLRAEGLSSRLILQVHDELILECPPEEAERAGDLLSEEMEQVADFSVPLVAESLTGKSWYDAK